jgi:hypothetical protein
MPTLADELADIKALNTRNGPRCGIATLMETCEPSMRETLMLALDDPTIQHKAIGRWLALKGIDLSHWTIAYHRRGDCACG